MSLTVTGDNQSFELAPEGVHVAICTQVIDLGTQHNQRWNKDQRKVLIGWELANIHNSQGEPFLVWRRFTASLSPKAALRQILESWRGRAFTEDELQGFDLRKLLNAPCQVAIVHNESDEGMTYANVQNVMGIPQGLERPHPVSDLVMFELGDNPDWDVFATFREKLQETIKSSPEYKALQFAGEPRRAEVKAGVAAIRQDIAAAAPPKPEPVPTVHDDDDEPPF